MLLRLPSIKTEAPHVRWRRGHMVDVDPEYAPPLLKLGAIEVTYEEAAEVIVDKGATPAVSIDEPLAEPSDKGKKRKG